MKNTVAIGTEGPRLIGFARNILRAGSRVPLFYKLLVANSLIVILGATAGTMITAEHVRTDPSRSTLELVGLFAALGTVVSVCVNAWILKLALAPVRELETAASRVHRGNLDVQAETTPFADRDFERVIQTFNDMLHRVREYQGRLRGLASRATRAAEAERKRIAQELHDDTAQRLAALKVRVRVVADATDPAIRSELLEEMSAELDAALKQVRLTAHGLRPDTLEELGLAPALRQHARRIEEQHGVDISIGALPQDIRLEAGAELAFYRIVQEALLNAARHADASSVMVEWAPSPDELTAIVRDDGRGFDVDAVLSRRDRLGLFGMMERAAYQGGAVEIDSRPNHGTRIRVVIPLEGSLNG